MIGLGRFTGGHLWICEAGKGKAVCTKRKFYSFNGRSPHRTLRFKGNRITMTFYCHRSCSSASALTRRKLKRLGAKVPTAKEAQMLRKFSLAKEKGSVAARIAEAKKQWMRFSGAAKSRSTPGRKAGEHARHAWVCGWCGKSGAQSWGTPKKWCSPACQMRSRRANEA